MSHQHSSTHSQKSMPAAYEVHNAMILCYLSALCLHTARNQMRQVVSFHVGLNPAQLHLLQNLSNQDSCKLDGFCFTFLPSKLQPPNSQGIIIMRKGGYSNTRTMPEIHLGETCNFIKQFIIFFFREDLLFCDLVIIQVRMITTEIFANTESTFRAQ